MTILSAVFGLLGLITGSFLNVVISRLEKNETVVWGRSRCPECKNRLRWFELIPVFSFIIQGGYCRRCKKPISRIYPAVEFATGFLFAALGWGIFNGYIQMPEFSVYGSWPPTAPVRPEFLLTFVYYAFFMATAVAVSFYDFIHRLVPLALILPLILIGLIGKIAASFYAGDLYALTVGLAVAASSFLFFWSIWFFSKGRAMGRGDADAALAIAVYLNPYSSLLGFLFAFWLGAIAGVLFIASGRLGWKSQIPFTPFLFLGAIIALFTTGGVFGQIL